MQGPRSCGSLSGPGGLGLTRLPLGPGGLRSSLLISTGTSEDRRPPPAHGRPVSAGLAPSDGGDAVHPAHGKCRLPLPQGLCQPWTQVGGGGGSARTASLKGSGASLLRAMRRRHRNAESAFTLFGCFYFQPHSERHHGTVTDAEPVGTVNLRGAPPHLAPTRSPPRSPGTPSCHPPAPSLSPRCRAPAGPPSPAGERKPPPFPAGDLGDRGLMLMPEDLL